MVILLGISLAPLIVLFVVQIVTIWRGAARYGGFLASRRALARQNEAQFDRVLCRLAAEWPSDAPSGLMSDESEARL